MSTQQTFDDLARLSDTEIESLLRVVDQKDCVIALKGAGDAVNAKFLGNMSERVQTFYPTPPLQGHHPKKEATA